MALCCSVLHSWRSWVFTHSLCSHFSSWEKLGTNGVSWHWADVPLWSQSDASEVKLFLPSSVHLVSDFSLQWCAGTSLLGLQTPTKILSSVGNCENQCFLGGWQYKTSTSPSSWSHSSVLPLHQCCAYFTEKLLP